MYLTLPWYLSRYLHNLKTNLFILDVLFILVNKDESMCSSGSDREASGESLLFQSLLIFFYLIDLPTLRSHELLFMPYSPFI